MKKILSIFITILFVSTFISCSDKKNQKNSNGEILNYTKETVKGITTIINENKASQPSLKIELKKALEISGINEQSSDSSLFERAHSFQMDEKGNLYLLEGQRSHIYKYSKSGKLIKKFGRPGTGPGEFSNVYSFLVANDSIYVPEFSASRISKFDDEGNFAEYKLFEGRKLPNNLTKFGKDKLVGSQGFGFSFDNGIWKNRISLEIYSKNLTVSKQIFEYEDELDFSKSFNPLNIEIPLSCSDTEIFLSENDDDNYQINVLDDTGKKVRIIKKKYRKVRRTKEERKEFQESNTFAFSVNGEAKQLNADAEFKKAIRTLDIDKSNRIWVRFSVEEKDKKEGYWYDIFSAEGVFLNRIKLDIDKDVSVFFMQDKIVTYNREFNIIKVYDY